jgi:hypothetical protein
MRLNLFPAVSFGAACTLLLMGANAAAQSDAPSQSVTQNSTPSKTTAAAQPQKTHASTSSASVRSSSAHRTSAKGKMSSSRRRKKTARGQQKIDSERAQSIQEALIREHYLGGEATGKWNQACEDAMRRYQGDHGWQTKTVPDARALIQLGLGPSKDHLLNPESAMTSGPDAARAASLTPPSHSADPAVPVSKTPSTGPMPASASQPDRSKPQ